MKKKGQISIEFLSIFGFVFLMLIPLIIVFYLEFSDLQTSLGEIQMKKIGDKIVDTSEKVYYQGPPSQTTLKLRFPEILDRVEISNNELIMYYFEKNEIRELPPHYSSVNISGSIVGGGGPHFVVIQSQGEFVSING